MNLPRPSRAQLIGAAVVLAALVGAFSAGRFSAPLQVQEKTVEKVVFKDRVVEKIVKVESAAKTETRIVFRDRTVKPDGTKIEHEEERTATAEESKADTRTEKESVRTVEKLIKIEKVTTLRSDWRVGVLVGGSYQQPLLPIAGPLVLGVEVDRRIVGGLSVGVWTLPQYGAIGGALSFEF